VDWTGIVTSSDNIVRVRYISRRSLHTLYAEEEEEEEEEEDEFIFHRTLRELRESDCLP